MKRASTLAIALVLCALSAGVVFSQSGHDLFQQALVKERADGNLQEAIKLYQRVVSEFAQDRALSARALVQIGQCYEKLGNAESRKAYERIVREFSDQPEPTKVARERLSALTGGAGGTAGRTEAATRRVWLAGSEQPVSISPDGRLVVFIASDVRDLWIRDLQSGERTRVTREASSVGPFTTGQAVISPDGKRIAYEWFRGGDLEIRVSALDGSSMQVLDRGQAPERLIGLCAWMPDGRRLLTISLYLKDRTRRRQMISLPDGAIRDVGRPETGDLDWAHPSPDGRYIAYDLRGDIFVYDTTTEQDSVLVQNPAADKLVGWTPDGTGVVFVSDRTGTHDLYLLGIEQGRPKGDAQLLRRNIGAAGALRATRDGRLFRFDDSGTSDSYIVSVDQPTGKLSGTPSRVDPNYAGAVSPQWSSDGKLLYYQISKGAPNSQSSVLVIRAEATGETREFTPKLGVWIEPTLSPDGRRFAVSGINENNEPGVYAVDSASGSVSQITKIPDRAVKPVPNWSPDGRAFFYNVRLPDVVDGKRIATRRKNLATGEETDFPRGHHMEMRISPDGTRLAYVQSDGATKSWILGILDVQSGTERELWRVAIGEASSIKTPAWTPDGKYVLVARVLKQGSDLWRVPAEGGPAERLHVFADQTWGFALHPSGTRMAFTQERKNFELWVLENFLPAPKAAKK
jgi:Tol biopolymer transport system component